MERVLIIDDDVELCELVTEYLTPEGFEVEAVHHGEEGLKRALVGAHVLVVLDVMLPGIDGYSLQLKLSQDPATKTLPIVMFNVADPVETRIIESLRHPGGNITGLSYNASEASAKRVQLLQDAVPGLTRVAVLWNSRLPAMALGFQQIEVAAPTLGVTVQSVRVAGSDDFDQAFAAIGRNRPGGLVVLYGPMRGNDLPRIVEFVTRHKLPTVFELQRGVQGGGLMEFGPSLPEMARQVGAYVDKIVNGAKPADLPVEEPSRFELIVNVKAARAMGITIPQPLLLRADEVIQ